MIYSISNNLWSGFINILDPPIFNLKPFVNKYLEIDNPHFIYITINVNHLSLWIWKKVINTYSFKYHPISHKQKQLIVVLNTYLR